MIIKLLLWLILIAANVYADRKGRKPNYLAMFCVRGFASIVHAVIVLPHPFVNPDYMRMTWWEPLVPYLPVFIFQATSFWLFFELGLNIVRGKPLLYFDTREKDSGWIDKFFASKPVILHTLAKAICLIILIISVCVIYSR